MAVGRTVIELDPEQIARLAEAVSEFADAVNRLEKMLDDPEHRKLARKLTDERFQSVTRG